jgi:hypothetical protein
MECGGDNISFVKKKRKKNLYFRFTYNCYVLIGQTPKELREALSS